MKLTLDTSIDKLKMVGRVYSSRLKKLEIYTIKDLLYHAPHRYNDFSKLVLINTLQPGEIVSVKGKVLESKNLYTKYRKIIQKVWIDDGSGKIEATWFNQKFIPRILEPGKYALLAGEVKGTKQKPEMVSPEYELIQKNKKPIHAARLVPVYPETKGLSSKWIRSRIAPLINMLFSDISDYLPKEILIKEDLISINKALKFLHFPNNTDQFKASIKRLAFDEMLQIQIASRIRKDQWKQQKLSKKIFFGQKEIETFIDKLPFKLTSSQEKSINEIMDDITKNTPMNRLLLGDVGSGKTVVAATAIYATHLGGLKSFFMAPTEILALQHEKTLSELLSKYKIEIATLTGSKKINLDEYDVVVGTHALIYKNLKSTNAGLVIIDEQQRFGVEQRSKLIHKGKSPHILTMTATPIPRSVALTIYGDLDLSTIDEMPPGRIQVKTSLVPPSKRQAAYKWIASKLQLHQQLFVVCPLIEESIHESMKQIRAAKEEYQNLQSVFAKFKLALLHGKIKSKEKETIINKFRNQKIDILVTTPVVEVGIDIPNATIMLIEGSERFGLSQLHQLRGRVGRGDKQSYCLLFASSPHYINSQRLKAFVNIKDGKKLAEMDLKLRGPGEIYGTKQHGFPYLKFSSYLDYSLISKTQKHAEIMVENAKIKPKYSLLKNKLSGLEKHLEPN